MHLSIIKSFLNYFLNFFEKFIVIHKFSILDCTQTVDIFNHCSKTFCGGLPNLTNGFLKIDELTLFIYKICVKSVSKACKFIVSL